MARSKIITTHEARKERANTIRVPEIIRFEENQTVLIYEDGSKKIEKHADKKRMSASEIFDAVFTGVLNAIAIVLFLMFAVVFGACIIHDAPESTAQVGGALSLILFSFGIVGHYLVNLGNE